MANEEHLEILKQGVDVWNAWRESNLTVRPDLSRANLIGCELERINFSRTDLDSAQLDNANLIHSDFSDAFLSHTVFRGAILDNASFLNARLPRTHSEGAQFNNAVLMGASLRGANLTNAALRGAKFWLTDLGQAKLANADLTNAVMGSSFLGFLDLSVVKGLETVRFTGPLSIGIETIYLSNGQIPEGFLRGAGIPYTFIEYAKSLVGLPFDFYSVFISYSSKDHDFAARLYTDLQNKGVRCWFAPEDLKIGEKFRIGIDESIRIHDKLLLILSKHSVSSDWVEQEVEAALEKEREQGEVVLFPIRLDEAVMEIKTGWPALVKRTRHIGDFARWKEHNEYQKAFKRLLRDLKAEGMSNG